MAGLVNLLKDHVVAAAGPHEGDAGHVTEALDPPAALVVRAANVKQVEADFVHLELGLKDSRSQDTAGKQVLIAGDMRLMSACLMPSALSWKYWAQPISWYSLLGASLAGAAPLPLLPGSRGVLVELGGKSKSGAFIPRRT